MIRIVPDESLMTETLLIKSVCRIFGFLHSISLYMLWTRSSKSHKASTITSKPHLHKCTKLLYTSAWVTQRLDPRTMAVIFFFFCNSAPHTHTEKARVSSTFNLTNDWRVLELMYSLFNLHSRQVHCLHVLCITYLSTPTPSILLQKTLKIFSQKSPWNLEWTRFYCCPKVWSMVIITVLWYYCKAATELLP